MYCDQVGSILEMQSCFYIKKINVVSHIKRIKGKNHKDHLHTTGKAFNLCYNHDPVKLKGTSKII